MLKFKGTVLWLVIITMVFSFVGCKATKKTTSNEVPDGTLVSKEPITFSMLYADNASYPIKKDWLVLEELKKRTNVNLDLQVVPDSDYQMKMNVLLSSGDFPDIITKVYAAQISDFATNELLLPFNQYYDKLPNYTKRVKDWDISSEIDLLKELNGNLYVLPGFSKSLSQSIQLGIRYDLLDKYGLKVPQTYDELYQVLKTVKQKEPEMLGLSDRFKGELLLCLISRSFGTNAGWSLPHGYTYDYAANKWNYAPISDNYRTMLKYLNKLYKEGLLDSETFTQDDGQCKQKLYNGKVMAAGMWIGEDVSMNQQIANANGAKDANFNIMLPLEGPTGIRATKSSSKIRQGVAINAKVKDQPYFDQLLKFVDWFYYSDEGINLSTWGVEGTTYEVSDGKKNYMSNIKTTKNPQGTLMPQADFGFSTNSLNAVLTPDYQNNSMTDEAIEFGEKLIADNLIPLDDPMLRFKDDEKEKVKLIESTLQSFYKEMTLKFIFGHADIDTDWDKYVNQCYEKRLGDLMSLIDYAWTRQPK